MKESSKDNLPQITFLIGMGRSGTTLLTNMLNSNPEVISTPENEFILFTHSAFAKKEFNAEHTTNSFLDIFNYEYNKVLSIWKPSPELKLDILQLQKKDFANVCKLVYLNYPLAEKNKTEVKCIVDKNPVYSLYLNKICTVYPNAKFIVLVRDFRDNVLSRKKYAESHSSIFSLAAAWNYYYDSIFRDLEKYDQKFRLVKYEDLVADSEKELKGICEFLNVSYSPEMLNYRERSKKMREHIKDNASDVVYTKITTMHSNLDAAVNQNRVKAYEKELTKEEIGILEYMCGGYAQTFGYEISQERSEVRLSWKLKKVAYTLLIRAFHAYRSVYYQLPISWRLSFLKKK